MNQNDTDETYARLQEMYELMQQLGLSEEIENAIFDYEDCVSDEDYARWREKYGHFL